MLERAFVDVCVNRKERERERMHSAHKRNRERELKRTRKHVFSYA